MMRSTATVLNTAIKWMNPAEGWAMRHRPGARPDVIGRGRRRNA